jgi:hypothetical protein
MQMIIKHAAANQEKEHIILPACLPACPHYGFVGLPDSLLPGLCSFSSDFSPTMCMCAYLPD